MRLGRRTIAGGQNKLFQLGQLRVVCFQSLIQNQNRFCLEQLKARNGQFAAQIEKLMLYFDQHITNILWHFFTQQQTNVRVQFIHIAHGMHTQTVFRHALVVAQAGGALVACSGSDLCQSVSHGVFPVRGLMQKCRSQRKL